MASKITPLNREIQRTFYPLVKSKGFIKQKPIDPHFAEFRRESNGVVDVFDIQWDKYWRPYFVVNFRKERIDGDLLNGPGRLQRKVGSSLSCWFTLYPSMAYRILHLKWRYAPEDVVSQLIVAFGQLEDWWENGETGNSIHFL